VYGERMARIGPAAVFSVYLGFYEKGVVEGGRGEGEDCFEVERIWMSVEGEEGGCASVVEKVARGGFFCGGDSLEVK
jgi:hypothetical protein